MKKYLAETGDNENLFVDQLAKYRENPVDDEPVKKAKKKETKKESDSSSDAKDSSDDSSDDSSSEDSDSEEKTKKKEVKTKAKKDDSSSEESSSNDSSSSSGSDGSNSSDESDKDSDSGSEEEEQEVVKKGELPKKYAFLGLPHDEKTPAQRRWKWVKFEFLPEDMKPYIRPPSNKTEKKDKDTKKKPVKKDEAEEKEETVLEIIDDRDMDYTKQDNVDIILNKYKNQQISRRNFDPEFQIVVLDLMLEA